MEANPNRTHDRIKQRLNTTNIKAHCLVSLYYYTILSSIIDITFSRMSSYRTALGEVCNFQHVSGAE